MEIETIKEICERCVYQKVTGYGFQFNVGIDELNKKVVVVDDLNKRLNSVMNVRNNEKDMRLMIIDIQRELRGAK